MKLISSFFDFKSRGHAQMVNSPVELLVSPIRQKQMAFIFAFGCLIFTIISQYLFLKELKKPERVFAIDSAQTVHIGPLETLQTKSHFFENLCLVATQSIFLRSPVGLDAEEFLDTIFSSEAKQKIIQNLQEDIDDIKGRNLHQKPEISTIKIYRENSGMRQFLVEGKVISAGSVNTIPIAESTSFRLLLNVVKNAKINERGAYPFIIKDLHIEK